MKKLVLVFTLAAFALTTAAFAQVDPAWQDNIGIYADETGTEICTELGIGTPKFLYLVLTQSTANEVWGWEAKISYNNLTLLDFQPRGQYIDAGTREGEHLVGLSTPLPVVGGTCVLADLQVFMVEFFNDPSFPSHFFVDSVYFHVLPDAAPAYLSTSADDNGGNAIAMNPATIDGHEGGAVFFLNNGCTPVAVEESTWGSVKGLFR
jgi:hypothetical protein